MNSFGELFNGLWGNKVKTHLWNVLRQMWKLFADTAVTLTNYQADLGVT
jgi:hypothetical protein